MKKLLVLILFIFSLSTFAANFAGIYKISLPSDDVILKIYKSGKGVIVGDKDNMFILGLKVGRTVEATISWENDASPELSRFSIEEKSDGTMQLVEHFTIFNDGDAAIGTGDVKLIWYKKF